MTEWYYAEGQQRQGPLVVIEIRQRFQRGQLTLDTLVWREGMAQWAPLRQMVDELGLQTLADASTSSASGGFDLRTDYAAIDNGSAPLPGTGALSSSPYDAPAAGGGDAVQPVLGGEVVLAGFWKRVAAYLIDYALVTAVTSVIGFVVVLGVVGLSGLADESSTGTLVAQGVNMLISLALTCAYYAWFHASKGGATLGKMAVGIKVVRPGGERLTMARAIGRYFGFLLSGLTIGIGYLMAAFTDRKQALHDMICDTLVVDRWAFTDQPHLQRRELGAVTVVVLVIGGVLMLVGVLVLIGVVVMMAKGMS